jgi:cytochrome c oxidase subunit IV
MAIHGNTHGEVAHHSSSIKPYIVIIATLFVLTVITVVVAQFDFGNWNIVVAMLVASVKATLVALYFMHLKHEDLSTWIYAIVPIFLLAIMLAGILIDNPYRTKVSPVKPRVVMSQGG